MVTTVSNVSTAATRAAHPTIRPAPRNPLRKSVRSRPDFGVDKANIPRSFSFLSYSAPVTHPIQ